MVLDWKSLLQYLVNTGVPKGSILGPKIFLLYINHPRNNFICHIAIHANDISFYSKWNQTSDLWQQLELASELGSHLQDTVDLRRKWLLDFNVRKTQLVSLDKSTDSGVIDVKKMGLFLKKNHLLRSWGCVFLF